MTWNDITYKRYLEIKDKIVAIKTENSLEFQIQFISIIFDIPVETINKMSLEEYYTYCEEIKDLYSLPSPLNVTDFEYNNESWMVDLDINTMTVEQWLDLESIQKSDDPMGLSFALIVHKTDEPYNGTNRIKNIELIYNMPVAIVYGIASFFLNRLQRQSVVLAQSTQLTIMTEELEKLMLEMKDLAVV